MYQYNWVPFLAVVVLFAASAVANGQTPDGVHGPLPIAPTVSIPNSRWLLDLYLVVFNREADDAGFRTNYGDLESGITRDAMYNDFVASAEFQNQVAVLGQKQGYIERCYQVFLLRSPSPTEVSFYLAVLQSYNGQGGQEFSWPALMDVFYGSDEYYAKRCQTGYYSMNAQVAEGALLLRDVWSGAATIQTPDSGATPIGLTIPSATDIWDQKLPIIEDPEYATPNISIAGFKHFKLGKGMKTSPTSNNNNSTRLISFTRAYNGQQFTIVLMESFDGGLTLSEVEPLWPIVPNTNWYDAQLSIDNTVCPPMFTLAMECATPASSGAASLCVSQSPTPGRAYTWSTPVVVVNGCSGNNNPPSCGTIAAESASTGCILMDNGGADKYLAWTQVYDGVGPNDPQVHTYSQMAGPVASVRTLFGTVMSPGVLTMMPSEPHPWCTDAWDCNNRDKQDWKKELDYYYALYNGANYYRCNGAWGISVSRSATAASSGPYQLFEGDGNRPIIPAALNNTCGISYPVLNVIQGELFVYFAYHYPSGQPVMMRSRLVPT